ncbi:hypothetical protein KSD_54540 [Ktedonobacter sp. SOSP1-85]|uniref:hypothetical protein n=1 Tax=Ktedonobacter sp. SOSP1-85 TaxID=2778367 RepID=UPI001916C718|nr:hypothetical protein [Ktedonobacter sp. SOSP1-85]GHO77683.1 hypothetical protein KSD_54540 [Ktedonobacter sp. SOSP1-85]
MLAAVRALNSLESVGESMRAALNDLAKEHPEWLLSHVDPDWFDRYVHRFEMTCFPKQESKQQALHKQVGEDVSRLARLYRPARDALHSASLAICDGLQHLMQNQQQGRVKERFNQRPYGAGDEGARMGRKEQPRRGSHSRKARWQKKTHSSDLQTG